MANGTEQGLDAVADRLEEVKDEMLDLLREARRLVRGTPAREPAEAYWLAHIEMALHDDHSYLGKGGVTMASTVADLRAEEHDDSGEGR